MRSRTWQWHLDRMRETARGRLHYVTTEARPQQAEVDGWSKDKRKLCHHHGWARARDMTPLSELLYLDDEE